MFPLHSISKRGPLSSTLLARSAGISLLQDFIHSLPANPPIGANSSNQSDGDNLFWLSLDPTYTMGPAAILALVAALERSVVLACKHFSP